MARSNILGPLLGVALSTAALLSACNGGNDDSETPNDDSGMGGEGNDDDGSGGETSSGGANQTAPGITGAGLQLEIKKVEVSDDRVATVEFTLQDDAGRPLDREGKLSQGAVNPSFILSWLKENEKGESAQYVAYTLREKDDPDGGSVTQSSTDSDGVYETLDLGHYRYTFGSEVKINDDRSKLTHTLGVYATREHDGTRYVSTEMESWVPDGSDVETVLDVVTDASCNGCHTRLEFHGGSRRGTQMCNLCHTEKNSKNPESGNTIDFQVMIHKIHMGKDLPSVVAGKPYYFIGYRDHRADYSDVSYPWDMRDCTKCHTGSQGDRWATRPALKPCASCHDRTYFGEGDAPDGWKKHTAGPRDDSECGVCHAEDSLDPISKSHKTSLTDVDRPEVVAELISIKNTSPGSLPQVEFRVTIDGEEHDVMSDPLDRLRLRLWGPNTDPTYSSSATISNLGSGILPLECDAALTPPCIQKQGDNFVYHYDVPIPAEARGSYTLGMDGRLSTKNGRVDFINPLLPFAITGEVEARREIVSRETCNSCHGDMGFHGGAYKEPEYCLNCHNSGAFQGASGMLAPGGEEHLLGINLKDFIHRIHAGTAYSAPLSDCSQCHLEGTEQVPLTSEDLEPSTYAYLTCDEAAADCKGMEGEENAPIELIYTVPPESAACISCHESPSTFAHAETNSGKSGEACATCHGAGKEQDVSLVHMMSP